MKRKRKENISNVDLKRKLKETRKKNAFMLQKTEKIIEENQSIFL